MLNKLPFWGVETGTDGTAYDLAASFDITGAEAESISNVQCLQGCDGGFVYSLSGTGNTVVNVELGSLPTSETFAVRWTVTVDAAAITGALLKGTATGTYDTSDAAGEAGRVLPLSPLEPQYKMKVPNLVSGQGAVLTTSLPDGETAGNLVAVGEDVTVTMKINVPKGVTTSSAYVADFSDSTAGYNFVGATIESPVLGSDLSVSGDFPTVASCGSNGGGYRCTVDLGTITNDPDSNSGDAANSVLSFQLAARVGTGIIAGETLTIKGTFTADNIGIPLSTGNVEVLTGADPSVIVSGVAATRTADAGDGVDFGNGVSIALGGGSGPAYNLVVTFTFSSNMEPDDPSQLRACVSAECSTMMYDVDGRTTTSQMLAGPFVAGDEMTLVLQTTAGNAIAPFVDEESLLDVAYSSAPTNGKDFNAVQQSLIVSTADPTVVVAFGTSNVDETDNAQVTIGEEIEFKLTVQLPEGTSSFDVDVDFGTDGIVNVPANPATVAFGSSIASVPFTPTVASGHMTASLATVLNTPDASSGTAADNVVITFPCVPSNEALLSSITSATKAVSATVTFAGEVTGLSASADLEIVSPNLVVSFATVGLSSNPDAGDTVNFKAIITHSSSAPASSADAYLVSATFRLPAAFVVDVVGATGSAPKGGSTTITALGDGIKAEWAYFQRFGDSKLTVEFSAQLQSSVTPGEVLTSTAGVEWTSVPTAESSAAVRSFTEGDGTFPWATDTAVITINSPTVQIEATAGSVTPGGDAVMGEDVPFTVIVTLPEGAVKQLSVTIDLEVNTDYLVYQTAQVVSIGSQISGSALGAGAAPTSTSSGVITFDFGDLSNVQDNSATAADTIVISVGSVVKDFSIAKSGFSGFFLSQKEMKVTAQVTFAGSSGILLVEDTEVVDLWPAFPVQANDAFLTPAEVDAGDTVTCSPFFYMHNPPGYSVTGLGLYNMKVRISVSSLLVDILVAAPDGEQCSMTGSAVTTVDGSTGDSTIEWTEQKVEGNRGQGCTQGLAPTVSGKVSDAIKYGDDISCVFSVEYQSLPIGNPNGAGAVITNNDWRTKDVSVRSPSMLYLVPESGTQSGYGIGEVATVRFKVAIPEITVDLLVKVRIPQINGEVVGRLVSLGVAAWSAPTGCTKLPDTAVASNADEWDLDFGACSPSILVDGEQDRSVEISVEFMAWDPDLIPQLTTYQEVTPLVSPTDIGVEALAMFRKPGTSSTRAISSKTVSVVLEAPALDISLQLLFAQEPLAAGQTVHFRITLVHSTGSAVPAKNIFVAADLAGVSNLKVENLPAGAVSSNPTVTSLQWDLSAALEVEDSLELEFTAVVEQGTILGSDPITVAAEATYSSSPGTADDDKGLVRKVALPSTEFALVQDAALDFGVTSSSDPYTTPDVSVAVHEKVEFSMVLVIPPAKSLITAVFSVDGVDSGALTIRVLQVTASGGIGQNTCDSDFRETVDGSITYDFGTCTPTTQGNITVVIEATVEKTAGNTQGQTYDARATLTHSDGSLGTTKDVVASPITITIVEPLPSLTLSRAVPSTNYIFSDSKISLDYTVKLSLQFGHQIVLTVGCQGPVTLDRYHVELSGSQPAVLSGASSTQVGIASVELAVGSVLNTGAEPLTVKFLPVLASDATPMSQIVCSVAVDVRSSARLDAKNGRLTQLSEDFVAISVWYMDIQSSIVATDVAETDSDFEMAAGETATIDVTFTFRGEGPLTLNLDLPVVDATAEVLASLKTGAGPVVVVAVAGSETSFAASPSCSLPCLYSPSVAPIGVGKSQWKLDFGSVSNLDTAATLTDTDRFVATVQVTMANTPGHTAGETGVVTFTSTFDSARNDEVSDKVRLVEPSASLSGDWSSAQGNDDVVIGSTVEIDVSLTAAATSVTSTAFDVSVVFPRQSVLDAPFENLIPSSDWQQDEDAVTFERNTIAEGVVLPMKWTSEFSTALQAGATLQPIVTATWQSVTGSLADQKEYTATHVLSAITAADLMVSIASNGKDAVANTVDGTIGEILRFDVTIEVPYVSVPGLVVDMVFPDSFMTVGDPTVTATGSLTVAFGTPADSLGKIRLSSSSTIVGVSSGVETITINFGVKVLNNLNPHPTGSNLGDSKDVAVQIQYGSGGNSQTKEASMNVKIVEPRLGHRLSFEIEAGDAGDLINLIHEIRQVDDENTSPAYEIATKITLPDHMSIESAELLNDKADEADAPALISVIGEGALPTTGTLSFLNGFGASKWSTVKVVYQVRLGDSVPAGALLSVSADLLQYQTQPAPNTEARVYDSGSNPELFAAETTAIAAFGIIDTSVELVSRSGPYQHHSSRSVVVGELILLELAVTLPEGVVEGLELSASIPQTVVLTTKPATTPSVMDTSTENQNDANGNGIVDPLAMLAPGAMIVAVRAGKLFGSGAGELNAINVETPSIVNGEKVTSGEPSYEISSDNFTQNAVCGAAANKWDNIVNGSDVVKLQFAAVVLDTASNINGRALEISGSGIRSQIVDSSATLLLEIAEPVLEPIIQSTILLPYALAGVSTSYTLNESALGTQLQHVPSTYVRENDDQKLDKGSFLFDIHVKHAVSSTAPAVAVAVKISMNVSREANFSAVVLWSNGTYGDEVEIQIADGAMQSIAMGSAAVPTGLAVEEEGFRAKVYSQLYLPPLDVEVCTTVVVDYALPPGEFGQPSRRSFTQTTTQCQKTNPSQEPKSQAAAIALGVTGSLSLLGLLVFGLVTLRKKKRDRSSMQFTSISEEDIAAAKNLGLHPASKIDQESIAKAEEKERIKEEKLDAADDAFRQAIAFARMRYGKDTAIDEEKLAMVFKLLELPMPYNQQIGPLMARKDQFMNQEVAAPSKDEDDSRANALIDEVVDFVVSTIPDVLLESIIDTYAKLKEQIEEHHNAMKAAGNIPGGDGDEDMYEVPVALIKEFESAENPYAEIRDDLINAEGDYMMPAGFEDDPDYVDPVAFRDDDDEDEYAALGGDDVYMNRASRSSSATTVWKRPKGDTYGLDDEDVYAVANLLSEDVADVDDAVLMSQGIYANRQGDGTYGLREVSEPLSSAALAEDDVYGINRNPVEGAGEGEEGSTLRQIKEDEATLRRPESVYENRVDLSRVGQPGEESPYSDAAFATLRKGDPAAAAAAAAGAIASRGRGDRRTIFADNDEEDYGLGATVDLHPLAAASNLATATADANSGLADGEESPYSAAAFATLDRLNKGGSIVSDSSESHSEGAAKSARSSHQSAASSIRSDASDRSKTSNVVGVDVQVEEDTADVGDPHSGSVVYHTTGKDGSASGRQESVVYSQMFRGGEGDGSEYANTDGANEGGNQAPVYKRASQAFLDLPLDAALDRSASLRSNGSATSGVYARVVPKQGRMEAKSASAHPITPSRFGTLPSTLTKDAESRVSPPRRLPLRTYELENGVPADIHDAIMQVGYCS